MDTQVEKLGINILIEKLHSEEICWLHGSFFVLMPNTTEIAVVTTLRLPSSLAGRITLTDCIIKPIYTSNRMHKVRGVDMRSEVDAHQGHVCRYQAYRPY